MENKNNRYELIARYEKFVKVTDNWCPNYEDDTVKVALTLFGGYVKFNAWGMDDFGLEMEYPEGSKAVFETWKECIYDKMPPVVNQQWFYEHGFYPV